MMQSQFNLLRLQAGLSIPETAKCINVTPRTVRRYDAGETKPNPVLIELLRGMARDNRKRSSDNAFKFVDLFAGIGGLRIGFEGIGGECVFTSEWDKHSNTTYRKNFKDSDNHVFAGDIRGYTSDKAALDRIPAHDVLLAGFPCQPFSIAGVSKKNSLGRPHGFLCDTQGTLFFDVAKVIQHHRPRAFLLENVKNLARHDGGRTFATIMHVLRNELGYTVETRVLSSAPWVPQKRERIFIVGFRDGNAFSFDDLPLPCGPDPVLGDILEDTVEEKYTLTPGLWSYLQAYKDKHAAAGNGFGYGLFGRDGVTRTLSARYHKDGSEILVDQGEGRRPRRLTPRECAKLMGFHHGGREWHIPVSDTQAYRQFGNAVVVPVIEAIARTMEPFIYGTPAKVLPFVPLSEAVREKAYA